MISAPVTRTVQRLLSSLIVTAGLLILSVLAHAPAQAAGDETTFKRIQTQFIAALGDPTASSGSGAQSWGLWPVDPGPRGVRLRNYEQLKAAGGMAPAQWQFDSTDWWAEENGLIMEKPDFPLPPGKYVVTGAREVTTVLTIHPEDDGGVHRWELAGGAELYDVTHLPCRSARYTSAAVAADENSCSPAAAQQTDFPVTPGAAMPPVAGCNKQDYAVLFVIAVAVTN